MQVSDFSKTYTVKVLNSEDIGQIYSLCRKNTLYYQYCPSFVTPESILEDMAALPPGIPMERKYYVGYYRTGELVAVMDLIDGYSELDSVFIGFFMCAAEIQGRGNGSAIIQELIAFLESIGYKSVRLAWVKGNPQAEHFWMKNGFTEVKETFSESAGQSVILAEYNMNSNLAVKDIVREKR